MSNDSMPPPATPDDLRWWWETAPTLRWRWATTYADTFPHWYIAAGRTPGMTAADFALAGRVIRTFGEPGKFWSKTNLYLFDPARERKVWCMWTDPSKDTRLINLAMASEVYGAQENFDEHRLAVLRLGGQR